MYINLLIFCCTSNIKSSLKMCPVASVDVQYLYSFNLVQSVTSRKDHEKCGDDWRVSDSSERR